MVVILDLNTYSGLGGRGKEGGRRGTCRWGPAGRFYHDDGLWWAPRPSSQGRIIIDNACDVPSQSDATSTASPHSAPPMLASPHHPPCQSHAHSGAPAIDCSTATQTTAGTPNIEHHWARGKHHHTTHHYTSPRGGKHVQTRKKLPRPNKTTRSGGGGVVKRGAPRSVGGREIGRAHV